MGRAKQLKEIFATSFSDPVEWQKWFFGNVATNDDDAIIVHDDGGRPVSGLLLQPYTFHNFGRELPSAYISCVATRPEARGSGRASQLMLKALATARARGIVLAELIPASDALYQFYARSGFSGVFYVAEERYTAVHPFACAEFIECEPHFDTLHSLELETPGCVLHSSSDYANILADLNLGEGKQIISVQTPDGAKAFLFATYNTSKTDSGVLVRSLLADNEDAAQAALAALRRRVGERSFTVWRPADRQPLPRLRARGMARLLRPQPLLAAMAAAHPELKYTIRLYDNAIADNNGLYTLSHGDCTYTATGVARHVDLDVSVNTLTAILFSHPEAGAIFNLPTHRPYMAMMLD